MPTEEWWKHQFDIKNSKVLPLYSWNQQQSTDQRPVRKPFEVTKTSKELSELNIEPKPLLEQSMITEQVIQKYWKYLKSNQ